jgi:hypothetical protein
MDEWQDLKVRILLSPLSFIKTHRSQNIGSVIVGHPVAGVFGCTFWCLKKTKYIVNLCEVFAKIEAMRYKLFCYFYNQNLFS